VTFTGDGCIAPVVRDACVDVGTQTDVPSRPDGAPAEFSPLTIRQGAECSALSGNRAGQEELAARRLDATREWAIGRELQTGTETGNPNLASATVFGTGTPAEALACLDQMAADNLFGGGAFIHASPLVGSHLLTEQAIWRDGQRWRTAAGSVVVISPGYQGVDLYATSEVFAATGQRSTLVDTDRRVNTDVAWADELALAAFDPCWMAAFTTDVVDCTIPAT
jgi:hypothetical protein